MARIEKTVFISYRRADRWPALAVFKDLTQHGYDVFIDYDGIASGDFERAIVDNIRSRAHFVVLLTPTALERCSDPADWLRREIEVALEAGRNIVPLLLDGFTFASPIAVQRLQGSLEPLRRFQALKVPEDFFDAAMERLRNKHLVVDVEAVLHPAPTYAQQVAQEQRDAASKAADASAQERVVRYSPPAFAISKSSAWIAVLTIAAAIAVVAVTGWKDEAAPQPVPPVRSASDISLSPRMDYPTSAAAQYTLAEDYYFGRNGRMKHEIEAANWYRQAAEHGHAAAQAQLGFMIEFGRGRLAQDDAEAVKWYRRAAERGNSTGQVNLGRMYEYGKGGLERSDVEAVKWYRKAAELGHPRGQAFLADMYERGVGGLPADRAQALRLYRQAAAKGLDYAKEALIRLGEQ